MVLVLWLFWGGFCCCCFLDFFFSSVTFLFISCCCVKTYYMHAMFLLNPFIYKTLMEKFFHSFYWYVFWTRCFLSLFSYIFCLLSFIDVFAMLCSYSCHIVSFQVNIRSSIQIFCLYQCIWIFSLYLIQNLFDWFLRGPFYVFKHLQNFWASYNLIGSGFFFFHYFIFPFWLVLVSLYLYFPQTSNLKTISHSL